jgi:hypothetical protein
MSDAIDKSEVSDESDVSDTSRLRVRACPQQGRSIWLSFLSLRIHALHVTLPGFQQGRFTWLALLLCTFTRCTAPYLFNRRVFWEGGRVSEVMGQNAWVKDHNPTWLTPRVVK